MTQQEFVKKESEYYAECFRMVVEHSSWYHQKTEPFKSGLTKGLEITEFILSDILKKLGDTSDPKKVIEHYLTEIYGK